MPYTDLQLADAFIQTGELTDALEALDRHLASNADDHTARRLRAEVRARMPDMLEAALADFNALPEATPEDIILQSNLLDRIGRPDDALKAVATAHKAHPGHDRLSERYLHLLQAQGDIATAREVVAALPDDIWKWRVWAGDLAVLAGDDAAALTHYGAAIATLNDRYNLDGMTGAVLLEDATFGPSESISEAAALTIEAEYARLLLAHAGTHLRLGNLDDAEAGYVQAEVMLPDDVTILFFRGVIAHQRGDAAKAKRFCMDGLAGVTATVRAQLLADIPAALRALIDNASA